MFFVLVVRKHDSIICHNNRFTVGQGLPNCASPQNCLYRFDIRDRRSRPKRGCNLQQFIEAFADCLTIEYLLAAMRKLETLLSPWSVSPTYAT
jgi:hypothetical protein